MGSIISINKPKRKKIPKVNEEYIISDSNTNCAKKSMRGLCDGCDTEQTNNTSHTNECKAKAVDNYPIHNPIDDLSYASGKSFYKNCYPVDASKMNIGIVGRRGAGKSSLINALRGVPYGDQLSAGRYPSERMEPFNFQQSDLQWMVLWEIPYPRMLSNVVEIYDRNIGFDRFYDSHKLLLFELIFVLLGDGVMHDDDVAFSRIVKSRRTNLVLLSTKTDDYLDAELRESHQEIGPHLKKRFVEKAKTIFSKQIHQKGQALEDVELLYISAPVVRDILTGNSAYLHYKIDEDRFLNIIGLKPVCLSEPESSFSKEEEKYSMRPVFSKIYNPNSTSRQSLCQDETCHRSTVLADAGFEICYSIDDRIYGNQEPKCTVRRTGKTSFNYAFIGDTATGKSSLINAIRGMSIKHPLAAGRSKPKYADCQKFEFEDDMLAYSVTLYEMHYPSRVNAYFEYIDRYKISDFTAVFILIRSNPTDRDLTFAKIAFRRNATIVFLLSKCDKILLAESRREEIPICDLLKQRFVDKGIVRFDRCLTSNAPELCGRVHLFFVSATVFKSLRTKPYDSPALLLHEKAVFDFLKQKRMIAEMLNSPEELKEGLYANVNESLFTPQ